MATLRSLLVLVLCTVGSAEEAEGGAGFRPCPVPGGSATTPVAATGATSAVGPAVSPVTPPLAIGGAAVRPAKADNTRSTFLGASCGTRPRGAALQSNKQHQQEQTQCRERNEIREEV